MNQQTLIKRLDAIFSKFIRLRYANESGLVQCVTCGAVHHWKNIDCGHHLKRQHMNTRFDEMNCQCQCRKCNWLGQGEDVKFRDYLIGKYGQDKYDLLLLRKSMTRKWSKWELETLIEHYNKEVKKLLANIKN